MIAFQKIKLPGGANVGQPGPFPEEISASPENYTDEDLADLKWVHKDLGFKGFGFTRVEVADPPAPKVVPFSITRRQGRLELLAQGKLATLEALLPQDQHTELRINYDDALAWERSSQFVALLGAGLGLSSDQVDELFIAADKL